VPGWLLGGQKRPLGTWPGQSLKHSLPHIISRHPELIAQDVADTPPTILATD